MTVTRLDIAVEGFERPLKARVSGRDGLRKGSEVKVSIAPDAGLVFAVEAELRRRLICAS